MRGRHRELLANVRFAIDLIGGAVVLLAVYSLLDNGGVQIQALLHRLTGYPFRLDTVEHLANYRWPFGLILGSAWLALRISGLYRLDLHASWRQVLWGTTRAVALGLGLTVVLTYSVGVGYLNRSLLFAFGGTFWAYLNLRELLFRRYVLERFGRRHPRQALLVCAPAEVEAHRKMLEPRAFSLVRVAAVLPVGPGDVSTDLPVLGQLEALSGAICAGRFDLIVLHPCADRVTEIAVLRAAEELGVEVWYFAGFPTARRAAAQIDLYAGQPMVAYQMQERYESQLAIKRAFDVVSASLLLLVLSPLLLVAALAVKLSSPGPIIYRQLRTGWRGRPFAIWKFRTMVADADQRRHEVANEVQGPAFKSRQDCRITPVGHWLRRYSIDELPQLVNVLQGHMSLVGPRPLPVDETKAMPFPRDHRRYSVLPGLTGLWQVSGRSDVIDFAEWVRLDLQYIDDWSIWLDLGILLRTVPVVLTGQGAR